MIYHPLNRTLAWSEAGILDIAAASEVVDNLGESTFGSGVLNLVETDNGYAAVPSDGWTQLLVYRADLLKRPAWTRLPTTRASLPRSKRFTIRRRCTGLSPLRIQVRTT